MAVGSKKPGDRRRRNNLIALHICAGALLLVVPALLLWKSTSWPAAMDVVFWIAYLWLYLRLIRWRVPPSMVIAPRHTDSI